MVNEKNIIKDEPPVKLIDEDDRLDEGKYKQNHFALVEEIADYFFDKFDIFYNNTARIQDKDIIPISPSMMKQFLEKMKIDVTKHPDYKRVINLFNDKAKKLHLEVAKGEIRGGKYILPKLNFIKKPRYKRAVNTLMSNFFDLFASKVLEDINYINSSKIFSGKKLSKYLKYVAGEKNIQQNSSNNDTNKSGKQDSKKDSKTDSKSKRSNKKEKNNKEDEEITDFGLKSTANSELDKAKKFMQHKFKDFRDETDRKFGNKILKPGTLDDKGEKK